MVPNKICRSQNFGDAGYLLTIIANQDFMGVRARGPGALGPSPAPEPFGFGPVAPQAEFQGERFRDIGLQPLCNHGAINPPENSSGSTNGTQRHTSRHLSSLLCDGFEQGDTIGECFTTKTKLAFPGAYFLYSSPYPLSSPSRRFWLRDLSPSSAIRQRWRKRIDRRSLEPFFLPCPPALRDRVKS